jgi:SAM-dependent methyltransferase
MNAPAILTGARRCRFCGMPLAHTFIDLGMSPLANAFIRPEQAQAPEPFYPLHVYVCGSCFLVQLEEFESPQRLFSDYVYFSSYSESWLRHAEAYAEKMIARFGFGPGHQVVEIASNDGYLLRFFKQRGIPVLGIEPAENVARAARDAGIDTLVRFFGVGTAEELCAAGRQADLLLGNNVLAHVPDINDFVAGMQLVLKPSGVITMEFPYLLQLMANNQFDTIYHEHFSYLSLIAVEKIFAKCGLTVFDVEELPTHGGSLRIYARHAANDALACTGSVATLREREIAAGLTEVATYGSFADQVRATKRDLLDFLIRVKREGRSVVGYGAPAKGNTLLNYCGIRTDFLDYVVDRSPHKQGLLLPGTRIPVCPPDRIRETRPDYILILPWNLLDEIIEQMPYVRAWGARFVVPIPRAQVIA